MDKNPETNLMQTLNKQYDGDLSLTDRPVLVQNQLGIFFGTLKKADTRKGTALLSNGYAIDPKKHLTFTQYLRFLSSEDNGNTLSLSTIRRVADENTITDYATEGVARYHVDTYSDGTEYYNIPGGIKPTVELMSLTGVYAIVPVADDEEANDMWQDILHHNALADNKNNEIKMTVKETFIAIEDTGRGMDGITYTDEGSEIEREAVYTSPLIRLLIVSEDM